MTKTEKAQMFAHIAHDSIKQRRKYTGEPYWVHTDEVAAIVQALPEATEDMVCAAYLHDVLEDVTPLRPGFSEEQICEIFGNNVLRLVKELTDKFTKKAYPYLNRSERKAFERARVSLTSKEAKTIKLADLISNTKSIVAHDPDFAKVYLQEKSELLTVLVGACDELFFRAVDAKNDGLKKLDKLKGKE